jgi:hypothetical protein
MITVVGSRTLWPIPSLASTILDLMIANRSEQFAVRCNRAGETTSGTEDLVIKIGARTNINTITWPPIGGNGNFPRDNAMVVKSIAVHAFFAPSELMEGGTGHVAAVALRAGVPLTAYTLDDSANVIVVAEDEGDLLRMYKE